MDMALSNDKRIRKATKENIKMNQQCPTGAPLSQRRGAGLPAGTAGGEAVLGSSLTFAPLCRH